jgi:very-short-patch-repair endonuclease
VDFCCQSARLIIELDGGQHAQRTREDERRTQWLREQGYRVVRVWNSDLMSNPDGLRPQLGYLLETAVDRGSEPPHPTSPPRGEGSVSEGRKHDTC